jgi:hypothetical protein
MKIALTLTLCTLASLPLLAQSRPNLLQNGSFDSFRDISVWRSPQPRSSEANESIPSWIGFDALGSPDSGSMVVTGTGAVAQCAAVTGGQTYDFGARLLITTRGTLKTPVAHLKLSFFSDDRCAAPSISEAKTGDASSVGRFTAVSASGVIAPVGAKSALVSVVMPSSNDFVLAPGAKRPAIYVDEAFLRETGGCAPDANTLCFARGIVRATMRVIDSDGVANPVPAVQTSASTGYFAANPDQPDITLKIYDFLPFAPRWIVVGGMTNQRIEITVEDLKHHDTRTYTNLDGSYMETIVDAFLNP